MGPEQPLLFSICNISYSKLHLAGPWHEIVSYPENYIYISKQISFGVIVLYFVLKKLCKFAVSKYGGKQARNALRNVCTQLKIV